MRHLLAGALVFAILTGAQASAAPLLVISIDGMRPDYVIEAEKHGLRVPTLRKMMAEGAYARSVIGVNPTVTYPSHTTLVTGVSPAEHGIYNNTPFDPTDANQGGWYWYAVDIKVPTLFDAVTAAHKITANVEWPVTVGAKGIRYNIPEYRRAKAPDDLKLLASLVRPDGYLEALERRLGPYTYNGNEGIADDEVRARFAAEIIREEKPYFTTVHLIALDHQSHAHGPFSPEADAAIEAIDGMVDRLGKAALANDRATVIAVVSDHGFAKITHSFNWRIPFAQAGLIRKEQPEAWQVSLWSAAGANAAVMLKDPNDQSLRAKVKNLLERLRADPKNGIAAILDANDIEASGGWPTASFILAMKPGYTVGGAWTGELVMEEKNAGGTHGWLPREPDMHASFLISGRGIARAKNLGTIDMRRIAPTFAKILDVPLPAATAPALPVQDH
jgi:predicted AlkP superfamily pyrophosphatase or phosphodiesterase